jgi:hypothetical protein
MDRMIMDNLEMTGRKWSWPSLKYNPTVCLKGLRKSMKRPHFDEPVQSSSQDLSLDPSIYEKVTPT